MELPLRPKKLFEQVHYAIRVKHYFYRIEETYVHWIHRYILFHNQRISQLAIQFRPNFFNSLPMIAPPLQYRFTFR